MSITLSGQELADIDPYWRAAYYLSVGQIYLHDNPLLKKPLTLEHIKSRLLGHWGATPGLKFLYVHLSWVIKKHHLNMVYIAGLGPLSTAWHYKKFLNPKMDGAILLILHLNGYKIANLTVLARIGHDELNSLFVGYGYQPFFVEGDDPETFIRLRQTRWMR